jgi:hypothetical protein
MRNAEGVACSIFRYRPCNECGGEMTKLTLDELQEKEFKQQEAVRKAVMAADRIILDASDGTCEETNYLTAMVAMAFMSKTLIPIQTELRKKDLGVG